MDLPHSPKCKRGNQNPVFHPAVAGESVRISTATDSLCPVAISPAVGTARVTSTGAVAYRFACFSVSAVEIVILRHLVGY